MANSLSFAEKAEFDRARKAGEAIRNSPFAVIGVSCRKGRLTVKLNNGVVVTAPVSIIAELAGATPEQLAKVESDQEGLRDGLYWDEPDVAFNARGLLAHLVGAVDPRAIGRKGGSVKSEAKAAAVRENGKKGGRPKKAANG